VPADPFAALACLARDGRHVLGRDPDNLRRDAAAAVATLAVAIGAQAGGEPVHQRLACGWNLSSDRGDTIRRALVLLADHELNASTFAVRVAASTGASMAASLLAGLCALSGPRHGGAAERMLELAEEGERSGADRAVGRWLARDQPLPGFGHPLYPDGDPRAEVLLACIELDPLMRDLRRSVAEATGGLPNVDFALAALARTYALPSDAPLRLFTLARSVGWAAHALEQVAAGRLIRPRATYIGPPSVG
jgi:citrate synthase